MNARTLLATMFCALLAAILSSLPAILYTVKVESTTSAKILHWIEPQQVRLRTGFLALQVALTVMLLISAGLFTKSFLNALNVKLGIDTDHVVVATVDLRSAGYLDTDASRALESMAEGVRALPGVTHISVSLSVPIGLSTKFYMRTKIPGREWPYGKGQPAGNAMTFVNAVSPQYFDLLGMSILQGRGFRPSDSVSNPLVVIIDEKLARDLFPDENPLGQCVMFSTGKTDYQCRRIVGVTSSIRNEVVRHPGIDGEQDPAYYVPASQWSASRYVLIRTRNNPGPMIRTISARLQTAAPNLPYVKVEPLSLYRDQQTHGWRMGSALFGTSGILSLALAGIGIYAVLAFVVRQRTREIGIRIAIGATQADIRRLIVRTGLTPVVIGIAFGVAGAFASTRLMAALLFGVVPFDPATLTGSAFLPFIVGATACIIPSRRATRVDPAVFLRDE